MERGRWRKGGVVKEIKRGKCLREEDGEREVGRQ